jgi:hypothetical protein
MSGIETLLNRNLPEVFRRRFSAPKAAIQEPAPKTVLYAPPGTFVTTP